MYIGISIPIVKVTLLQERHISLYTCNFMRTVKLRLKITPTLLQNVQFYIFKKFSISSSNTEITKYFTKLHNVKIVHIKNISQIITLLQLLPICCRKKRIALKISSMQAWESLYLTRNFFIVLPYLIFPYKFDFHTKCSIEEVSLNQFEKFLCSTLRV